MEKKDIVTETKDVSDAVVKDEIAAVEKKEEDVSDAVIKDDTAAVRRKRL